jgi:cell division protein FtsL
MTYSSSLAAGRQRFASRNQNTTSFRTREHALGPVSNTIMLIVLACLLGLLYLTQVTKTNAFSYQINDLKQQQTALEAEHDQLVIDAARLQSFERVKNSATAKSMVSVAPEGTVQN